MSKTIKLSDRFTYGRLFRFALPTIFMMIFSSIYGVVDGFFISNFAGKTAFAGVNYIMPVIMILGTPGFMIGTGGSALVGRSLGENKPEKARRQFSLLIWFAIGIGIALAVVSIFSLDAILRALGCSEAMFEYARLYGICLLPVLPFYMLQMMFQSLFVTAEKPQVGFAITLACGLSNMFLDFLFVGVFKWGVPGAALATDIGILIAGIFPLIYFGRSRSGILYLCKTSWNTRDIVKTCSNGISELVTNLSMSLVSILYNWQLMRYIGEDGVSAYGVLMYVNMIFMAIFIGYTMGTAPILSYQYGAGEKKRMHDLLIKSLIIICISSVIMYAACEVLAKPLSYLFAGQEPELLAITIHAFSIYSYAFLFMGLAVYGSGFFTALNDGLTSGLISFFRTMVFQMGAILIFPVLWGVEGIWFSIVFAEMAAFVLVALFIWFKRKKFGY